MRLAIIGSGIAGMTAAHLLHERHEVHLFEADERPGGHAHTSRWICRSGRVAADTGFLVYNEGTYPLFTRLLATLGVATHPSDMSFSLSDARCGLEWRGTSLSTVFAQRRNVARPAFLAMLADVARFNRLVRRLLAEQETPSGSLADFLAAHRWSRGFLDWYLIPLGSAIWSADPETFTQIPARTFAEFFGRHGLLSPGHQPGMAHGDRRIGPLRAGDPRAADPAGLPAPAHRGRQGASPPRRRRTAHPGGPATFDHVIMATHSDQALALLADPTAEERHVLGAIRYQRNRATLHTDTRLLPANRPGLGVVELPAGRRTHATATLTYYLNRLQGFDAEQPVLVTLNRDEAIDRGQVVARLEYAHPVIDGAAVAVQSRQEPLSIGAVSFCGAYWGYGFHEDGVRSALAICRRFGAPLVSRRASVALRSASTRDGHPPAVRPSTCVQLQGGAPAACSSTSSASCGPSTHSSTSTPPRTGGLAGRHAAPARRLPPVGRARAAPRRHRSVVATAGHGAGTRGDARPSPQLGMAVQSRHALLLLRRLRPASRDDRARGVQHPVARAVPLRRRAARGCTASPRTCTSRRSSPTRPRTPCATRRHFRAPGRPRPRSADDGGAVWSRRRTRSGTACAATRRDDGPATAPARPRRAGSPAVGAPADDDACLGRHLRPGAAARRPARPVPPAPRTGQPDEDLPIPSDTPGGAPSISVHD